MHYLLYHVETPRTPHWSEVGMRHLFQQLHCLCREAAWLGRTPVFPRIAPLDPSHNDGIPCKFPLRKYLDTQNIELTCKLGDKTRTLSLCPIHEQQLRKLKIPADETLEIASGQPVTASQNRHFRLVARRFYTPVWYQEMRPLPVESFTTDALPTLKLDPKSKRPVLQVILQPSSGVRELAADIIRQLPPNYCAVHIRRGDTLRFPAVRAMTSPGAVSRALAQAGVAPGAPLYLMSDEKSRFWLHALRKQHPGILHYTDFPRLVQLVRPPSSRKADNYFLFCVEQRILQHSARALLSRGSLLYKDTDRKHVEYIVPHLVYEVPEVKKNYHPAEHKISLYRTQFERTFWRRKTQYPKSKILLKIAVAWCRASMMYCVLRLFASKDLEKYRNRRKALNIPS